MTHANLQNIPPHSAEAEQSVLGSLLLDNNAWDLIADQVSKKDFHSATHQLIFSAIADLVNDAIAFDVVTLSEHLQNQGVLEKAGGMAYIGNLARNTPTAANIEAYAEIVNNKAKERRLLSASIEVQKLVGESGETKTKLAKAESVILSALEDNEQKNTQDATTLCQNLITYIDDRIENRGRIQGISTGLTDLDNKISGLCDSDLIIVAGRPSMGKTAFALTLINKAILNCKSALLVSAEMSSEQIMIRLAAMNAKVNLMSIREGKLDNADCQKITEATSKLAKTKLHIDDTPAPTINQIRSKARLIKRKVGLDLVVVDYLQLLGGNGNTNNERIEKISRGLKGIAKELSVPVVALSQLNRGIESRDNKRPRMSDLRDSGAIEQDADVILFLYRDGVYNKHSVDPDVAEIDVGKQRNGPTGMIAVHWDNQYCLFSNLSRQYSPNIEQPRKKRYQGGFDYNELDAS